MTVAAAVEPCFYMTTFRTGFHMSAQCRSAALLKGSKYLFVPGGELMALFK